MHGAHVVTEALVVAASLTDWIERSAPIALAALAAVVLVLRRRERRRGPDEEDDA